MSKKSELDIIAEAIESYLTESDCDFQYGHCGTYALALHDATKGKAKLGMIRGSRYNKDDDYNEDVQVHSFVHHPHKPGYGIDSEGEFEIQKRANKWKDEMHSHPDYEDVDHDIEHHTRKEFVSALKKTGAPDHAKGYNKAIEHIQKSGILKHFNSSS